MREGRPRAVRSRSGPVPVFVVSLASLLASAAGCATEVSTLDVPPPTPSGGSGGSTADGGSGAPTGGQAPIAGSKASGGNGGNGGTGVSAFGGTATTGGKPQGGGAGTGGTSAGAPQGGTPQGGAPQGGAPSAGAGGRGGAGGKGGASSGGNAGASGNGSGGNNLACLDDWKGGTCDTCSAQTQSDKLACVKILECYAANSCGPATCSDNDGKCGANKIGQGTAGYPIAKQVYDCACL